MKRILALMVMTALVGCGVKTPAVTDAENKAKEAENPAVTVVLAKHEDCTIYQTQTRQVWIQWVRCKKEPKITSTETSEYCGKGCTRKVLTTVVDEDAK